jgi:predicted O-methyltransferase YrrM
VALYDWIHPHHPRLTKEANEYLENRLQPAFVGLEWGSGKSTVWLAPRVARLISVEHNPFWYERVRQKLRERKLDNVAYYKRPATPEAFKAVLDDLGDVLLDFALVDGIVRTREACALAAPARIRPGGILIIDDANWFLPSPSRSPMSVPPGGQPASRAWKAFAEKVKGWSLYWTSNGIHDTAI